MNFRNLGEPFRFSGDFGNLGDGRIAGGVFPLRIPGIHLWLTAEKGTFQDAAFSTPAQADGDLVGGWLDQSGNGHHVTQANAAKKPDLRLAAQNSLPVLRFETSVKNLLSSVWTATAQPDHIFCVAKASTTTAQRHAVDGRDFTHRRILGHIPSGGDKWWAFCGAGITGSIDDSDWHIFTLLANGASSVLRVDGADDVTGNAGANGLNGISIGSHYDQASNPWIGDVSEVLVYTPSLANKDRNAVESYLAAKWGIALT